MLPTRICVECSYIGFPVEPDTSLCPRCYSQYRVGQLMDLDQLAASVKRWANTDATVAQRRQQQHAVLQQHLQK